EKEEILEIFERKEAEYKKLGVLKYSEEVLPIDTDPESFLINFLSYNNINYPTLFLDGTVQCDEDRNRSLGDIYRLILNYFPDISLIETAEILYDLVNNNVEGIRMLYCQNIKKRVYNHKSKKQNHWTFTHLGNDWSANISTIDELGL